MRSFHFMNGENLIYRCRLRTAQVRPVTDQILINGILIKKISIVQIIVAYH